MALNVKAALLICMGFVGGMSWLLQGVALPQTVIRSPLVAGAVWDEPDSAANAEDRTPPAMASLPQFERQNAFDREAETRRLAGRSLAVSLASAVVAKVIEPALPPLAHDVPDATGPPDVVVAEAAAEESDSMDGDVALVAASTDGQVLPAASPMPPRRYRVAKGDTLMKIVRREWSSSDSRLVRFLVETNPKLRNRESHILVGEELLVPDKEVAKRVLAGEWTPVEGAVAVFAAAGPQPATAEVRWYTIRRNDSLTSIARRYLKDGRRWREILKMNHKLDPNRIFPGVRIKLPPIRLASA